MGGETSAGILLYRRRNEGLEVFLVHPGGPFFARKDAGFWTIPKGLIADGEEPLPAALRELREETGLTCAGPFLELGEIVQKGGKRVWGWAAESSEGQAPLSCSSSFEIEWPPKSGRRQSFPEVDRGQFFTLQEARAKINAAQCEFIDRLCAKLFPPAG